MIKKKSVDSEQLKSSTITSFVNIGRDTAMWNRYHLNLKQYPNAKKNVFNDCWQLLHMETMYNVLQWTFVGANTLYCHWYKWKSTFWIYQKEILSCYIVIWYSSSMLMLSVLHKIISEFFIQAFQLLHFHLFDLLSKSEVLYSYS